MMGSSEVLFVVYIRTSHLTRHSYNVYEESKFSTKTTIMKQVIDEKKCLEVKLWLEKKFLMKFKELFLLLKTSFKVSLKTIYRKEAKSKIRIGCMLMD